MVSRLVVAGVILAGVILTSCGSDPRNEADAYRTRLLADQRAADLEQARDVRTSQAEQAAVEQAQTAAARVAGWNMIITVASIAVCVVVIMLAVGSGWAVVGAGRSVARAAEVRANLIPLQLAEATRQFPVMIAYLGAGRFSLANPNTGGVMLLDTRQPGDRQLITAAGGVQLAGVVAREARRSKEPEGVAVITSGVAHG